MFVAVNSGNARPVVEGWAKSTGLEWPVLVDERRETETLLGFEISLNNISAWVVVDPDGGTRNFRGSVQAAMAHVDKLMPKARMVFNGIEIPKKLQEAARNIELGFYAGNVAAVAKAATSGSKKRRAEFEPMWAKLAPIAEAALKRAKDLEDAGNLYPAYKELLRLAGDFKGTAYGKTAEKESKRLKKNKGIRKELEARKLLDQGKANLEAGQKGSAIGFLDACRKRHPETEAGREAAELMKGLGY